MRAHLSQREPQIARQWEEKGIYALLRKARKGKKKYILHDGPPYANGHIHIGHSLNKILKDIILRYKSMRGFDTPFIPGWDCHGLPVEHQLFKEMKISKEEISQEEFRKKALDYAQRFVQIQKEEFKRLGIFADWEHPYLTMDKEYEIRIIQAFTRLFKQGYIYRDLKPVYWCPHCETALAEAEIEYEDVSSPSVYVKFELQPPYRRLQEEDKPVFILIWTTTPWTLPANVAIALHPLAKYSLLRLSLSDKKEVVIIAQDLIEKIVKKAGVKEYQIIGTVKGEELEGLKCSHPWLERESRVVLADFVDLSEGTGCVHIAPGHGIEDYEVGRRYKLPIISPVDERGCFNDEVQFFKGMNVFSSNTQIVKKLEERKALFPIEEQIIHSYPHCWRCKHKVIFRATQQWFMKVDHQSLRKRCIEQIDTQITWIPSWGRRRISSMLSFRPDWCLSRQRYWGVPIPIFYCQKCNKELTDSDVLDKVEELVRKEGLEGWFVRSPEQILPADKRCSECGERKFVKGKDILDVWFDSGVSHFAVLQKEEDLCYPADLYLEGSDQHRGWFQSSLLTAMALVGQPPFRCVLTHGFVVDGEGRKMSKSLGNVISPQEVIAHQGADILRLWVASADYNEDVKLSSSILENTIQAYRRIRNTVRFLLSNLFDFDPQKDKIEYKQMLEIDRWAIGESQRLLREVTQGYDRFEFHKVAQSLQNFCALKMSAFYLDILKDRLYTFAKNSMERRSAQSALYQILLILVKITAPILVFTAEEIWAHIPGKKEESVHLSLWPDEEEIEKELEEKFKRLFEIRNKVCEALEEKRARKQIRSSLEAKVILEGGDEKLKRLLEESKEQLPSIFIVSQVSLEEGEGELRIRVEKAEGEKCARCWNYSPTVGEDEEYKDLCARCRKVLGRSTH